MKPGRWPHEKYTWRIALVWLVGAFSAVALGGCAERSAKQDQIKGHAAADAAARAAATASDRVEPVAAVPGAELYAQHCAACHGANGDGRGLAAAWIFPRPRDFRAGRWRLISTANNVPTLEDLEAVLVRGMPGSAMVSWGHLAPADRRALAEHVLKLRRDGARDVELKLAAEAEEELSEQQLAEAADRAATPGEVFVPPPLGDPKPEAIARGKEIYVSKGCAACHGDTGKGDGQQKMVDAEGLATRPRDLTLGIFKGNHDPVSVYRRIWLGMPGSPMPASQQLTPEQAADLVHFVLSLSTPEMREAAVMRRGQITARRVAALPDDAGHAAWKSGADSRLPATPLWWRDDYSRRVDVQAVHDGKTVALRISWDDPTHDASAARADLFEDMVAVQLVAGSSEPFLGMGAAHAPAVDVWQWRAGTRDTGAEDQQSDDYPFDTAAYRQQSGDKPPVDFVTARAAGNPLAARETDGANLAAQGLGTLTFRPRASQVVAAEATWHEGRWTVILRRPLAVGGDDGLSLAPGQRYSVGFAVWDGSARDRGPQKLITLWNDLQVE